MAGFWITRPPAAVLPDTAPDAVLGAAVRAALAASRLAVPTPRFGGGAPPLDAPLWQAGVRSRRAFMTGTRLAWVAREGDVLRCTSARNGGSTGPTRGWAALPAPPPLAATTDDVTLGAAVRAALARAQPTTAATAEDAT